MKNVLIKPIITEQAMQDATRSKYHFVVATDATKEEIKREVHDLFSVTVLHIATSITKGRSRRVGARRIEKLFSNQKKAVVTVKKGETIGWFEQAGK
jgi:large subunit ribosomal protein L23